MYTIAINVSVQFESRYSIVNTVCLFVYFWLSRLARSFSAKTLESLTKVVCEFVNLKLASSPAVGVATTCERCWISPCHCPVNTHRRISEILVWKAYNTNIINRQVIYFCFPEKLKYILTYKNWVHINYILQHFARILPYGHCPKTKPISVYQVKQCLCRPVCYLRERQNDHTASLP